MAGIGEEQDAGGGKGRVSKAENETAASRIWLGNFIQTAPPFLPAGGWPYEAYTPWRIRLKARVDHADQTTRIYTQKYVKYVKMVVLTTLKV